MPRSIALFAVLLAAWSFAPKASAGSFSVVPVKLRFEKGAKTAELKVTNNGSEPVTVQVEAVAWTQDPKGEDRYEPTKDLVVLPKIVTIGAGEERLFRVGYQGRGPAGAEMAYRIFLQELPVSKPGETAVKMALRMGIPVFVSSGKEGRRLAVGETSLAEGSVRLRASNRGSAHLIVSKIRASGKNGAGEEVFARTTGGWYLLPGSSRTYTVQVGSDECRKAATIVVDVEAGDLRETASLKVDPALCGTDAPAPPETPATEGR